MTFRLCRFTWDEAAQAMRLEPRFRRVAKEQYRDGESYLMMPAAGERHDKRRAFYFASIRTAFQNLQGDAAEILTSEKLLRGWALVQTGWLNQHVIEAVGETDKHQRAAAERMAVFARSLASAESYSEIAIKKVDGKWFVIMRTPRSQSRASMTDEEFDKSYKDVLDALSGQIEVKRRDLEAAGRKEAV